jgi:hypothetical protein
MQQRVYQRGQEKLRTFFFCSLIIVQFVKREKLEALSQIEWVNIQKN